MSAPAGHLGEGSGRRKRDDSTAPDLFPETLPRPTVVHHPHVSTTGEAQRQRILEMLHSGRQSTLDFRRAGIMQSQTRIHELRVQGYDIPTVGRVTAYDDQGYPHTGVALYELLAEPAAGV